MGLRKFLSKKLRKKEDYSSVDVILTGPRIKKAGLRIKNSRSRNQECSIKNYECRGHFFPKQWGGVLDGEDSRGGLASVKEQRIFYKKNEVMLCDQNAILKRDASFRDSEINTLNIQIEKLKKEKESNQIKIDKFENTSKSLDKLIGSQISDNNRKGVGYNAFPPLPAGLFAPPTIDLSSSGLKEFQQPKFEGYGVNVNKSVSENSLNEIKKNMVPQ
ncbi:hypothetical protein Tco_0676809 [Tanacetum coccineum]